MRKYSKALLLVIITFAVYFSSLFNHFVWDDEQFIYRNQYVATFNVAKIFSTNTIAGAGETSNYYRPITTLSFAWDHLFWGLNPIGYHITNTLLHIGAGIVLYIILKKLRFSKAAFWLALLFLVHPIQTEAVTYANSRGDSMFTLLGFASLLSLLYVYEKKSYLFSIYNLEIKVPTWIFALTTPVLYIASILGKEIGIAILGLHGLLLLYLFISTKKNIFTLIKEHTLSIIVVITNIIVAGGYLLLRATTLNFNNSFDFYNDASIYSQSLLVRLLTFCKIIFIYIKLLLFPYPLHMERDTALVTSPTSIWPLLFTLLVTVLVFLSWHEFKKKHSVYIGLGSLWFFVMLVPVSGIIAINGLLYEHWLYVPMVGFFIALYGVFKLFFSKVFKKGTYLLTILVLIYSILTIHQNYLWGTPVRFYSYLLKHTDSARIHNNLAMSLAEEGKNQEALLEYEKALEFGLPYPNIYHNMANTYVTLGQYDEAEKNYLEAIKLNPNFFHSYIKLIELYVQLKEYDKAIAITQQAQQQFPNDPGWKKTELQIEQLKN